MPGPKKPPSFIQLPGGLRIKGWDFRITKLDEMNRPIAFEYVPEGTGDSDCVLWAQDIFLEGPLRSDLLKRVKDREPKPLVTTERDVVNSIGRCTRCGYEGPGPKHVCLDEIAEARKDNL